MEMLTKQPHSNIKRNWRKGDMLGKTTGQTLLSLEIAGQDLKVEKCRGQRKRKVIRRIQARGAGATAASNICRLRTCDFALQQICMRLKLGLSNFVFVAVLMLRLWC